MQYTNIKKAVSEFVKNRKTPYTFSEVYEAVSKVENDQSNSRDLSFYVSLALDDIEKSIRTEAPTTDLYI